MLADLVGQAAHRRVVAFRPSATRKQLVAALAARIKSAARRAPRGRRLRGHRRRGARHGRALDDARAARADARLARRRSARTARRGDGPAGADRELRSRVRARADAGRHRGDARRAGATWCSSASRTASASASSSNGEVLRGRHNIAGEFGHVPLVARRSALLVRRRTAAGRPTSRTARRWRATSGGAVGLGPEAVDAGSASSPSRISSRARAAATPRRSPPSRPRRGISGSASRRSINALDPARVYVGGEITLAWDLDRAHRARRARRAGADAGGGHHRDPSRSPRASTRACTAPRRSSRRRPCRSGRGLTHGWFAERTRGHRSRATRSKDDGDHEDQRFDRAGAITRPREDSRAERGAAMKRLTASIAVARPSDAGGAAGRRTGLPRARPGHRSSDDEPGRAARASR